MPVTVASLNLVPYQVTALQAPASVAPPGPVGYAGPLQYGVHTVYPTATCRNTLNITPPVVGSNLTSLSGTYSPAGNTIVLKFFNNEITSVRLPCPAPAGVNFFVTDNLSGCRFYVDRITGSMDLIVYHANTLQHTAGNAANADVQLPAASTVLDNMHTAAQADYANHYGLALNNVAVCNKQTYMRAGGDEERRKNQMGRANPSTNPFPGAGTEFMGGTTIVGFPVGATWQFYYQTWGDVGYKRPHAAQSLFTFQWKTLHKTRVEGRTHQVRYDTMSIMETGLIY